MINNLENYNEWKLSQLDRLTARYRARLQAVYERHTKKHGERIEEALRDERRTITLPEDDLAAEIEFVMLEHIYDVTKAGVSDAFREITPDKQLSTWKNYPFFFPVEDTFTELAERSTRDAIFKRIARKLGKRVRAYVTKSAKQERDWYLFRVKTVFETVAKSYFDDPDNTRTKVYYRDILRRVFQSSTSRAETLFRTETTRYFNTARVTYFREHTDVDFVQLVAVTDGRISNICESRDGYVIPLDQATKRQYKPPFHPNCRTIQSPLITLLESDSKEVKNNLGSEFGEIESAVSKKKFKGLRPKPQISLPKGWT